MVIGGSLSLRAATDEGRSEFDHGRKPLRHQAEPKAALFMVKF